MFRDFGRRLGRDVKRMVDSRLRLSEELSGGKLKVCHHMHLVYCITDCVLIVVRFDSPKSDSPTANLTLTLRVRSHWYEYQSGYPCMGFKKREFPCSSKHIHEFCMSTGYSWIALIQAVSVRAAFLIDPEIDRVDLWRSIWGNTDQLDRSTQLLALLTTQLDSAPWRLTRSTWPTLYLILLDLPGLFSFLIKTLSIFHRDISSATHMCIVNVFVLKLCCSCFLLASAVCIVISLSLYLCHELL